MMQRHQIDADTALAFLAVTVMGGIVGAVIALLVTLRSVL